MSLLDSVSDDCVIQISKALSLFCVLACICHDMCMPLLFGLYVLKPWFVCVGCDELCFFLIWNFYQVCVACVLYVILVFGCKFLFDIKFRFGYMCFRLCSSFFVIFPLCVLC